MKTIFVIFKKELTDTLRDRRTIIMMVVLPLLLFPMLMNLMTGVTASHKRKAEAKTLKVGLITRGNAEAFRRVLLERKDMEVTEDIDPGKVNDIIQGNELDFAVLFETEFDRKVGEKGSGEVEVYYKATSENEIAKKRILKLLREYKKDLLDLRLKTAGLEHEFVDPVKIAERDIATAKEKLGEVVGGFLPYIFVLFCFLGSMYPAIDLAAGEKERATLETLLTAPAKRMQIVMGKFLVITLAGLMSAAISMVGLFLSVKMSAEIPQDLLATIMKIIEFKSTALTLSLLIPLEIFFAAALLSMSIYAKSFKEAQSIITPMNFMVIIPVAIGMVPGIKLTAGTALIPILNVSLATKEIISGTIQTGLLMEVYLSLLVLAGAALFFCARWFNREDVVFRGI
jgi:sodium transport system permease protein